MAKLPKHFRAKADKDGRVKVKRSAPRLSASATIARRKRKTQTWRAVR